MSDTDRLLTLAQVSDRVILKRTAIYAGVKKKTFPSPLKAGYRSLWRESEITAWMDGLKRLAA